MSLATIISELEAVRNRPSLFEETELGQRAAAIDFLHYAAGTIRAFERSHGATPETRELLEQATDLERDLRNVDRQFFAAVRGQIRSGKLTGSRLRAFCNRFTGYEPRDEVHLHLSLDPLDILVTGVLHPTQPPQPTHRLAPDMVAYQPSPASALLELVDRVQMRSNDVFYDLGSGLGAVVILANLLTGVQARGVEIDPGLCDYGRGAAEALSLAGVAFINADVRAADLSDGTIFYLFTPFMGKLLAEAMARLQGIAQHHRIRIGTYGPMTPIVAGLPWLRSLNMHHEDPFRLAVFESRETTGAGYAP